MAPAAKTNPETAETPASVLSPVPAKRSVKLLFIILLAVILVLVIVAAALVVLVVTKKKGPGVEQPTAPPLPVVSAPAPVGSAIDLNKPPIFVQLESFTVNLRSEEAGENTHYLQADIALRVNDQKTSDALKHWMPEIRNRINLILTSKSLYDVQSDLSHEKMQSEILRGLNTMFGVPPLSSETMQPQAPLGPIQGVLFISFIVQ
ncbi:MAG: flagellar basal body-associated FliL family protein [Betaproteobacteria bacterium]|nr:flagellar basal body-associated FliL family protein [Betaproteobacteria bacterium]